MKCVSPDAIFMYFDRTVSLFKRGPAQRLVSAVASAKRSIALNYCPARFYNFSQFAVGVHNEWKGLEILKFVSVGGEPENVFATFKGIA